MFLATVNKLKQLLYLSFIQQVSVQELEQGLDDLAALLADLSSGFRLISDLSRLDAMDVHGAHAMGKIMELCAQKGVGVVVRVVPDPAKDIGFNILANFHYPPHHPMTITCTNMVEAAGHLAL
jgi:hypothetical protein